MSDAARQNLKVSREGIVLIKSFEGFRPRAIQRAEGGWIIGYGHTLSAREGASVSEADAELLLRYDLLPVEKSVNETVPGALNQHQFDALVSFAFSVGIDDFAASDVRQRLKAGAPGEAADAMMGWPEPALPETALRRRAAERALFVANPGVPVALFDLLSAPLPLPLPAALAPVEEPQVQTVVGSGPTAEAEIPAPIDPRGAAVAALLGEPAARLVQAPPSQEPIIPTFAAPAALAETIEATPEPSNDNPPVEEAPHEAVQPEPELASTETSEAESQTPATPVETAPAPAAEAAVWKAARYAPYSMPMVGSLPYLLPAQPKDEPAVSEAAAVDHSVVETVTPAIEEPTTVETVLDAPEVLAVEQAAEAAAIEPTLIEPMAYVAKVDPAPAAELVLTPLEDAPEPALARPLWTPEQRDEPDGSENNLFGEDLALTQGGGSIMRHEIEMEAPARFDWSETGPFIFMGGVGLVSFGASMAAFRRAAEQSGGSDLTIIGWVLALIGLACVGVSSVNLYRKFGLPGGD